MLVKRLIFVLDVPLQDFKPSFFKWAFFYNCSETNFNYSGPIWWLGFFLYIIRTMSNTNIRILCFETWSNLFVQTWKILENCTRSENKIWINRNRVVARPYIWQWCRQFILQPCQERQRYFYFLKLKDFYIFKFKVQQLIQFQKKKNQKLDRKHWIRLNCSEFAVLN